MAKFEIYDKPMCCSTGVCGPQIDPVLPKFAADLDWLNTQGHLVERYNLAQQPAAFAENEEVKKILAAESVECLPLILVDGRVVSKAVYPGRDQLAAMAKPLSDKQTIENANAMPISSPPGKCCGGSNSC